MFQLYDRTRRRISIALFVLLAVVPTAAVLGYALWLRSDAYVSFEADRLGRQLGVSVCLKGIRHLAPAKVVYDDVQLADPESGRTIFRCGQLEALWQGAADAKGNPQPTLVLAAGEADLDWDQSQQAWLALDRFLTRRTGGGDTDVQFRASHLTLRATGGSHALDEVQIRFRSVSTESWADLGFRLARTDMPDPVRFCAWRNRKTTPPVNGFLLDTGRSTIPCSLLPSCLAVSELLGSQSLAQGCLQAYRTEEGWTGRAKGRLWRVDLDRLVTTRFPHTLCGLGQVAIESAQFGQGRLQQLQGTLQASGGQISGSLVDAASQWLNLQRIPGPLPSQSVTDYSDLALAFLIDDRGLQIRGRELSGPILTGPRGPLLSQTAASQQPMPVASLLKTLLPAGHVPLPTSPQAECLLAMLPCLAPANSETQVTAKPSPPSPSGDQETAGTIRR